MLRRSGSAARWPAAALAPWQRQAARVSLASASQAQRGAVVHRGAHNQPGQGSNTVAKAGVFRTGKTLVVVFWPARRRRQPGCRVKQRVGRQGTRSDAGPARRASSARMITSALRDPYGRLRPCGFSPATRICGWAMPEFIAQVSVDNAQHFVPARPASGWAPPAPTADGWWPAPRHAAASEHHHHARCGALGQVFSVPGKRHLASLITPLLHRGGDHGGKLPTGQPSIGVQRVEHA